VEIGGLALSTTSLAVVYAVLVETGLNRELVASASCRRPSSPTGLTFGTITSLYGLNAGIIDRTQFSLLIAVVVLSAIVPTAIAQRFFPPQVEPVHDGTRPAAPMPPRPAAAREGVRG